MSEYQDAPTLASLVPFQGYEQAHKRYVHLSRFHGSQRLNLLRPTRMPANSRRYTAGDPVHLIDWRAYARNEQLVLREHQDDASCYVTIMLNDSETMQWPDEIAGEKLENPVISKRELGWRILLHLAYQAFRWGDKVKGLWLRGDDLFVLPMRSQLDVAMMFKKLSESDFAHEPNLKKMPVSQLATERADLFYWISDGLDSHPDWLKNSKFSHACWIHVLSSLEVEDTWLKESECYSDENSVQKEYMGHVLKDQSSLKNAVSKWRHSVSDEWLKQHLAYILATDETSIRSYVNSLEQAWSRSRGRIGGGIHHGK